MSDQYRALTRAYRPQSFDDIVSQEHVSSTLKNAIKNNRISHAYMFCGPRGVGKTTMARVLARTINEIDASVDGESLSQTLNVIEMDAASNNKVEDVHHLRESVRIPPQNGRFKVFIVDEVHMLSKSAFNALLKTLEEPPAHAIFIFATTEPHKVLPTILSRVQRFDFKRISVNEIVNRLKKIAGEESITIDDESLHIIAKKADGALRDALGLLDQAIAFCGTDIQHDELLRALNVVGTDRLFEFTDAISEKKADAGLQLIHDLIQNGTDIQEFLVSLTEHLRNLYVAGKSRQLHLIEGTPETKERYKTNSEKFSEEDILRILHLTSEAQIRIRDAQQPKTHFEILMLKLVHMHRTQQLNELMGKLEELKKNGLNDHLLKKNNILDENGAKSSSVNQNMPVVNQAAPESKDAKITASEEEINTDSGDELFGKPTLGYSRIRDHEQALDGESNSEDSSGTAVAVRKNKKIDKEAVLKIWPEFLDFLENNVSKTLYYQVQRVTVTDVKGHNLYLTADNELACKLVIESQQVLGRLLKKTVGTGLKIHCRVERTETNEDSLSPYEQFKVFKEKDPKIKTIVELFGAELEY